MRLLGFTVFMCLFSLFLLVIGVALLIKLNHENYTKNTNQIDNLVRTVDIKYNIVCYSSLDSGYPLSCVKLENNTEVE